MILYRTTQQEKDALVPSKLDFGKILLTRHKRLSSKIRRDISLAEIGEQGENKVVEILKEFGNKDWIYLENVWLDKSGRYETDIIVITNAAIYVFEVKNYEGIFVFDNGDCKINNYDLADNCIAQTNRAYKKMHSICDEAFIETKIHGALIFIGEYNTVEIKSPIGNIEVIKRSDLKSYIYEMIEEERNFHERQVDIDTLMQQLNRYSISNPFIFQPLSEAEFSDIRTGICCARCHNFDLDINRNDYIMCMCGLAEPREEAIIRTICDYGVLTFDKNFEAPKLIAFLNRQVSRSNLYQILEKHFLKVDPERSQGYMNRKLPLAKINNHFKINKPKKLYLKQDSFIVYSYNEYNPAETISGH